MSKFTVTKHTKQCSGSSWQNAGLVGDSKCNCGAKPQQVSKDSAMSKIAKLIGKKVKK